MSKCIVCGIGEAIVPDRNSLSRAKKICRKCHGERLMKDLRKIEALYAKKKLDWERR